MGKGFRMKRSEAIAPILERLELEVWWMAGSQRRSLKLEAFRQGVMHKGDAAVPFTADMPDAEPTP